MRQAGHKPSYHESGAEFDRRRTYGLCRGNVPLTRCRREYCPFLFPLAERQGKGASMWQKVPKYETHGAIYCSECQTKKLNALWWANHATVICNACYSSLLQVEQGRVPGQQREISTTSQLIRHGINTSVRELPFPKKYTGTYEKEKTDRGDFRARMLRKFGLQDE